MYRAHDIVDPVLKLQKRHANRVKRLLKRHRLSQTGDVALAPPALEQALFLRGQYQSVIAQLDAAATPAAPASLETCPTCNQQFETKVGLRTHIARKHPETVQRYIPRTFSHLLSVDGLPHCAACRKRFPQMKGLKDHLLSGACSAPAELRALDDQAQPTTAPTSSLAGLHPRQQRLHSTLQTHTAVELGRDPASRELLAYCLICGFWTHDHGKIKSHIRQAHRALWDAHGEQAVANCGKAGLVLLKGQSCPCCEKHVHDKRLHPGQCPVLFQILFYDAAHSLTRCRGGPLRRFMPTAVRAPLPTATLPSIPASPAPAPAPHLGGVASSTFSSEPRPLRNISNFCYVNSVISALIPTGILNDHGPASRALHREASGHAAMGPHVLTASFSLRHVTPTWRYDGSQQDASEYLTALFRGLSSFPISRPWETKDPETGSTLDRGGPLLLLPTPVGQDTARLQDLLDAWSGTPAHTALNGQQSLVTVAVARFVEGRKLHYTLSGLHRPISIPQWTPAGPAESLRGWVQSCIFHIGDGPHSGHYRCIWRKLRMTTGRARTMAAHLSRPQNQTCDRLAMEVTYCWCVPFFRTSLLLAPLDLCTYGYGVPLRPGPPASLAGGVFYWLCGTDLFAQQGAERLLFRYQGRTSFSPFCHSHLKTLHMDYEGAFDIASLCRRCSSQLIVIFTAPTGGALPTVSR